MNDFTLIGLAGAGRVGKNSIADRLTFQHGFWALSIAEPLYDGLVATLGLPDEALDPERKEEVIPAVGRSMRELLQGYGDFLRTACGRDVLLLRLEQAMRRAAGYGHDAFVVTDVRLAEEVEWVRNRGGAIWWVSRPDKPDVRSHLTEEILALYDRVGQRQDVWIRNDGTREQLVLKVDSHLEALLGREFAE